MAEERKEKQEKLAYVLSKPFWDGEQIHKRGDVLYFEEGKAPKGSKEYEAPAAVDPVKTPASDKK